MVKQTTQELVSKQKKSISSEEREHVIRNKQRKLFLASIKYAAIEQHQKEQHTVPKEKMENLNNATKEGDIHKSLLALSYILKGEEKINVFVEAECNRRFQSPVSNSKMVRWCFPRLIEILFAHDDDKRSSLYHAAHYGHLNIVKIYMSFYILARAMSNINTSKIQYVKKKSDVSMTFEQWLEEFDFMPGAQFKKFDFDMCVLSASNNKVKNLLTKQKFSIHEIVENIKNCFSTNILYYGLLYDLVTMSVLVIERLITPRHPLQSSRFKKNKKPNLNLGNELEPIDSDPEEEEEEQEQDYTNGVKHGDELSPKVVNDFEFFSELLFEKRTKNEVGGENVAEERNTIGDSTAPHHVCAGNEWDDICDDPVFREDDSIDFWSFGEISQYDDSAASLIEPLSIAPSKNMTLIKNEWDLTPTKGSMDGNITTKRDDWDVVSDIGSVHSLSTISGNNVCSNVDGAVSKKVSSYRDALLSKPLATAPFQEKKLERVEFKSKGKEVRAEKDEQGEDDDHCGIQIGYFERDGVKGARGGRCKAMFKGNKKSSVRLPSVREWGKSSNAEMKRSTFKETKNSCKRIGI